MAEILGLKDAAALKTEATGTQAGEQPGQKVTKTEAEWRALLTPEQFNVLRGKGTERAFSGKLYENHTDGMYHCGACNAPLFTSETKFESGSGWPSFFQPVTPDAVEAIEDNAYGMRRVEVVCGTCGSHLGHVFPDGPRDQTGLRYCINSASLHFAGEDGEHKPGIK